MISAYVSIAGYVTYFAGLHIDFIAALCVLIAATSFFILSKFGYRNMINFYDRLFGTRNPAFIIILDFIAHYLPVILLGVPLDPMSYLKAYLVLVTYYVLMYNNLQKIYGIVSPEWADPYVIGTGFVIACLNCMS